MSVPIIGELREGSDTPLGPVTLVVSNPIQKPGADRLLDQLMIGGPKTNLDHRVYLSERILRELREHASQSPTQRVLLAGAGIRFTLHRAKSGWLWGQYVVVSRGPVPEPHHIAPMRAPTPADRWISNPFDVGDPVVQSAQYLWGPGTGEDVRMTIHIDTIDRMLGFAAASATRRVLLPRCGIGVFRYEKLPRTYKHISFVHQAPRPD